MRKLLILCLLLSACTPHSPSGTPVINNLQPYLTVTPDATPAGPGALVVSLKAPPPSPTPFTYTVQSGDTLGAIADKFNVQLDVLMAANPNVDPNGMPVGQKLMIPSNPQNLTGESTPTPVAFPIGQVACHPTADRGMWCFVLAHNDSPDIVEDVSAQVTLLDANGSSIASLTALMPLNILPPGGSLPLSVFFAPDVPLDARPQVQMLTAIRLLPGDARYLPAAVDNTLVQVDWSGLAAQVSGQVRLPAGAQPARSVWVAAVVYDGAGNVTGVRRWVSPAGIQPGGSLPFSFAVSSIAGTIERVDFAVEARP